MNPVLSGLVAIVVGGGCTATTTSQPPADAGTAVPADAGRCTSDALVGAQFTLADGQQVILSQKEPGETARGENTWTLRLQDAQGTTVPGREVALRPFMPQHGHATNPAEFLATETSPGVYAVGPFNLFMPGEWQLTVRVGMDVSVVIIVCLEG